MQSYIFFLPAAVALFWAVRVFIRKDSGKIHLLLAAEMLMSSLAVLLNGTTALFIFPFLYLAVTQKTSARGCSKWDWLIFLPSFLLIPYIGSKAFFIFLCVQAVGVAVYSSIKVVRFNRLMAEYFDASSEVSAEAIGQILFYNVAAMIVLAVYVILPDDILAEVVALPYILALFLSVLLFLAGHGTFNMENTSVQDKAAADIILSEEDNPEQVQDEKSPASGSASDAQYDALIQRVIDEKLYLDPLISLVALSERFSTNRTYLSHAIHNRYNQNFSEFINTLRIKYAAELLKSADGEARVKEIALQSGYNNVQSFYRNFSEIMEMTPKQWISK